MSPEKSQKQTGSRYPASTPRKKEPSGHSRDSGRDRSGRRINPVRWESSRSVKSQLGQGNPPGFSSSSKKKQRGDTHTPYDPSLKRLPLAILPDWGENPPPLSLAAYSGATGCDKLNIVKDAQVFEQAHDWLNQCTNITPGAIIAAELICANLETLRGDEPSLVELINKMEVLKNKFEKIQHNNSVSIQLKDALEKRMKNLVCTIYDDPEENDLLIPVLTSTQSIWKDHPHRTIRLKALELIFRNACTTKNYRPALACFETYKHNKKKVHIKKFDDSRKLIQRLYPLYVRLVNATSSIPPDQVLQNFEFLLKNNPDDLLYAQDLCLCFAECSECIFKIHKDKSFLIEQVINFCEKMQHIGQEFKNEQLIQLYCVLGRYHVLHKRFDEAQKVLAKIDALQKKCKTTIAPLVVRTELIISQAAVDKPLSDSDIKPLTDQLRPYINSHEGALIAMARLYMAATEYQSAKHILSVYKGSQILLKRLLGICLIRCKEFEQADKIYCELKKSPETPDDFPSILWEHAICSRQWAEQKSKDSEAESRRKLLETAITCISESISLQSMPRFWRAMADICGLIHSSSSLNFRAYKEQLVPIFSKEQRKPNLKEMPIDSWEDAARQAGVIGSKTPALAEQGVLELPNVLLPISSFTVNET